MKSTKKSGVFQKDYLTYRRHLLDGLLFAHSNLMYGTVMDVGGKKNNARGYFKLPDSGITTITYINIDKSTNPDIVADAANIPLADDTADCVLCCEVLEHIADPIPVCHELIRITKPGGSIIVSVPFMYPVHADPDDWHRFTPTALRQLFSNTSSMDIIPMGGWLGTVGMLLELGSRRAKGITGKLAARFLLRPIGRFMAWIDSKKPASKDAPTDFTTGYFCVIKK